MIGKALSRVSAGDFGGYLQAGHRGRDADVTHRDLRLGFQCHAAEDAGQSEHVLRFEVRCVAVAVHFHGHGVGSLLHILGNVELSQVAGVLREAYILAVDPQVEEGIYAVEVDEDALARPGGRYVETAAVGADFVAGLEQGPVFRRGTHHAEAPVVGLDLFPPGNVDVDIDGRAVALTAVVADTYDVPVGRDGDFIPGGIVKTGLLKSGWPVVRIGRPVEAPGTVEAQPQGAVFGKHPAGRFDIFEGEKPGVRQFLVEGQFLG